MVDISIQNLVKAFEEGKNILDGLSFEINSGERVCLLGKNGAGKTTLLKIIVSELSEDEGNVVLAPGKRVGLISQIPVYPQNYSTEDVLRTAHKQLRQIGLRLEELQILMTKNCTKEILHEYDSLQHRFELLGGYDTEYSLNKVASGLDIDEKMRSQLFSSLSGGEKTRVNLARLILEDTDILLLDEPTNHLDLRATEWLEEYLLRFKGTVLIISHDRWFLDRVAMRSIEIVAGKAELYSGNYSFYVEEKARRYEELLRNYEKEQKEVKRLDESARRLQQWGTGNQRLMKKAKAIRTRMERVQKTDRPMSERKMRAKFGEKDFFGDEVLLIDGLSKKFDERTLFCLPEILVTGGERIALIGDNGAGKTTLLRIIMGLDLPDSGFQRLGPSVKTAYLPQLVSFHNDRLSVLDTVITETNCSPQTARNRLGAFKFSGEDVFKPVRGLSGGEKSRLRLCILMREDINLLILDEPTNHLDLQSREWIEDALDSYEEALIFVSHDRFFIDSFASRIWVLENGEFFDFHGGFDEYRKYLEKKEQAPKLVKNDAKKRDDKKKNRISPEKQLLKIEREIEKREALMTELDKKAEEFSSDYLALIEIGEKKEELSAELDGLYLEWETLSS